MFRARTAENVALSVGLQWFSRVLQLITKVLLVRLLFPDDFGVFALATGIIGFVGTFGNFGLDFAILQKNNQSTGTDYDVGMSLRVVIAIGLFVVSFFVAGPWGSLFKSPLVAPATQVLALIYLIGIWSFVPATRLTSELRYRPIAIANIVGQVVQSVVSVGLAVVGFGLWALVYGAVLSTATTTAAFWIIQPFRFHLSFEGRVARSLLGYARHLVSAAVLAFLITNIDNFAVGYLWGTVPLGYYAVAYGYGFLPVTLLSSPAGSALFPSLTKIQNDVETLRRGYVEVFGYVMAIVVPLGVGMAILSSEIVSILFGPLWVAAAQPLLVLSFYGIFRAIVDFSSSLFAAVGKPRIIAELNLYILVASSIPLIPLTVWYGILGTAVAMTVPVALVAVVAVSRSARVLGTESRQLFSRLRGPLTASAGMAALVIALRIALYYWLPSRLPVPFSELTISVVTLVMIVCVVVGMGGYFAVLHLVERDMIQGMRGTLALVLRRRPR